MTKEITGKGRVGECTVTGTRSCARPVPTLPIEQQPLIAVLLIDGMRSLTFAPMGGVVGLDIGRFLERIRLRGLRLEDTDLRIIDVFENAVIEHGRELRRRAKAEQRARKAAGRDLDDDDDAHVEQPDDQEMDDDPDS